MPTARTSHSTRSRTSARRSTAQRSGRGDAISLLKADHREVSDLLRQFKRVDSDSRRMAEIVGKICTALTVHSEIEEELFYPAAREALKDGEIIDEAEVEHASIKSLVDQLRRADPQDEQYRARVIVLGEYVMHHVREEEGKIFPKIQRARIDLKEIGRELGERKQELMRTNGAEEAG